MREPLRHNPAGITHSADRIRRAGVALRGDRYSDLSPPKSSLAVHKNAAETCCRFDKFDSAGLIYREFRNLVSSLL